MILAVSLLEEMRQPCLPLRSVQRKRIVLQNLKEEESRYRIKSYRIGPNTGNILEEINQLSSSDKLDEELVAYLKHRCQPQIEVKESLSNRHQLKLELELSPQEIQFIEIQKSLVKTRLYDTILFFLVPVSNQSVKVSAKGW